MASAVHHQKPATLCTSQEFDVLESLPSTVSQQCQNLQKGSPMTASRPWNSLGCRGMKPSKNTLVGKADRTLAFFA